MSTFSKDGKAGFCSLIDEAAMKEFGTTTNNKEHPASDIGNRYDDTANKALLTGRRSLVQYLSLFPAEIDLEDEVFARNSS